MAFINSTDDSFDQEVLKSPLAVIQFSASWCGPCKVLKPLMEELSNEMSDTMKFYYHDIDSEPNVPSRYGVRGVPTVLIFKNCAAVVPLLEISCLFSSCAFNMFPTRVRIRTFVNQCDVFI